jgi:hypothetical protein
MFTAQRVPRPLMEARWEEVHASVRKAQRDPVPPPRPSNVRAVLDLGTLTYFTFRGRMYGVPPLPWQEGERLLDAWLELRNLGETVDRVNVHSYYRCLGRLSAIIWRNTRMVGRLPRLLKWLRIWRNQFDQANDAELAEVAVFYLARRTSSTGGFRPGGALERQTS